MELGFMVDSPIKLNYNLEEMFDKRNYLE